MRDEAMTPAAAAVSARTPESVGHRFRRSLRAVAREAAAAFARTPLEVLLGAAAATGFSTMVQWRTEDSWTPLMVTVGIALPLVYAASALYARGALRAPLRWGLSAAAVVGAALYGFLVFDPTLEAEAWRAFLLVAAALCALLCVPLLGHRPGAATDGGYRREATHRFAARLATRMVAVMVYAGALWVGLALALLAVNGLFELNMGGRPFEHLFSALFLLLPPWAVAAGLPALVAPAEPWGEEARTWLRRVGAFLLAPLVIVYLGIVYAYTVRVLVTGEVPKNLVSPVVMGAGLLIVLATVALEPVHEDEKAAGVSLLVRLASPLLFPLVIFAIWAVNARVDQYGWTEFRYLRLLALVLLALWGAASALQLFRRRRPPLLPLPAGLALVLLLSAVGPWSAVAVARRSQSAELHALLAAAGKSAARPATLLPSKSFATIVDKARYLDGHFGWAALGGVVPWVGQRPAGRVGQEQMASIIGIVDDREGSARVVRTTLPDDVGVPGIAGGTLYSFYTGKPPAPPRPGSARAAAAAPPLTPPAGSTGGISVRLEPTPGRLRILGAGDTLVAELAPLMQALLARADSVSPTDARAPVPGRPRKAPDGALELELRPGEAVFPLLRPDGRAAGQLVLRSFEFESAPPPAAASAVPARGRQPAAAPATSQVATSPAGARGSRILRVRAAAGFVILGG